jgi:hypothetical protein
MRTKIVLFLSLLLASHIAWAEPTLQFCPNGSDTAMLKQMAQGTTPWQIGTGDCSIYAPFSECVYSFTELQRSIDHGYPVYFAGAYANTNEGRVGCFYTITIRVGQLMRLPVTRTGQPFAKENYGWRTLGRSGFSCGNRTPDLCPMTY